MRREWLEWGSCRGSLASDDDHFPALLLLPLLHLTTFSKLLTAR